VTRRLTARLVVAAAALLLAGCGSDSGAHGVASPTPVHSGIDLLTVAGPTCPVQRAGQACQRTISARVDILRGATVVVTVQTGVDGTARVPLPEGLYVVRGEAGDTGLPRQPGPQTVTVDPSAYARVQLVYDTGIR
jgi:hypothetical protein